MSSNSTTPAKRPRLDIAAAQQAAAAAQEKAAAAAVKETQEAAPAMKELTDFGGFVVERVLQQAAERKAIFVLGKFPEVDADAQAIVILEKVAFSEEKIKEVLTKDTKVDLGYSLTM